jgi:hypothetical protein
MRAHSRALSTTLLHGRTCARQYRLENVSCPIAARARRSGRVQSHLGKSCFHRDITNVRTTHKHNTQQACVSSSRLPPSASHRPRTPTHGTEPVSAWVTTARWVHAHHLPQHCYTVRRDTIHFTKEIFATSRNDHCATCLDHPHDTSTVIVTTLVHGHLRTLSDAVSCRCRP